jgi:sugar (pentulose or hexulose) kinase
VPLELRWVRELEPEGYETAVAVTSTAGYLVMGVLTG